LVVIYSTKISAATYADIWIATKGCRREKGTSLLVEYNEKVEVNHLCGICFLKKIKF